MPFVDDASVRTPPPGSVRGQISVCEGEGERGPVGSLHRLSFFPVTYETPRLALAAREHTVAFDPVSDNEKSVSGESGACLESLESRRGGGRGGSLSFPAVLAAYRRPVPLDPIVPGCIAAVATPFLGRGRPFHSPRTPAR